MKNNFLKIFFLIFFCFNNYCFAEPFLIKSKNIEILDDGNKINAFEGEAISANKDLKIISKRFIYDKDQNILESIGNGSVEIKSKGIIIKFDKAIFDQKKLLINANGNIEIFHAESKLKFNNSEIFYDQKNNILSSNSTSKIDDGVGNTYYVDTFVFEVDKNLIKVKNLISKDKEKNIIKTSLAFINTSEKKIYGKDVKINLDNSSNENNNYRLKGNSVIIDKNYSSITKGVFTNCKARENCPPWQFSAKEIKHDKKKREIIYDKALLKVYDFPVAYFPKFFHPDPTVKRKSGFLTPSISSSSTLKNHLIIPYFHTIADNKDTTITPRIFVDEKILIQSEYRQKNINSNHIADLSIFNEKNKDTKTHFFYKFDKKLNFSNFESTNIKLKIQNTSSDTYLKSHKIKSQLINDYDTLENSIEFELFSDDFSINLASNIYEKLNEKNSDRYEYILPRVFLTKNLNKYFNIDGKIELDSEAIIRQYKTNILEKQNINNLNYNSFPTINNMGFLNKHSFLIRNTNIENKNTNYKNEKSLYLSGIYQFDSEFPLINEKDKYQNILKPKLAIKIAPSQTKDARNDENKIDISNIYSIDRSTDASSLEGGISATYGFDYSAVNKTNTLETLKFKLANNLRIKKNDDLSNMNQIGEKMSNIFSEILYNPSKNITAKYSSSIKNNFKDITNENIVATYKNKKFLTTFDFLNENNTKNSNSYISNKTSYFFNDYNNFSFSTRKNKSKDLTEYYNFMYQYKNDCLAASIEYNKNFYSDNVLKPEENIMFTLTLIPFAEIKTPNLNNN